MPTDGEGMEGRRTDGSPLVTYDAPLVGATRLRALIENWREAAAMAYAMHTLKSLIQEEMLLKCAKQLQEVLEGTN